MPRSLTGISHALPICPDSSCGYCCLLLQNFGLRDGLPGTAFHRSVQSRQAIEATLYALVKAAVDDPDSVGGNRAAVLQLLEGYKQELAADMADKTPECAPALAG